MKRKLAALLAALSLIICVFSGCASRAELPDGPDASQTPPPSVSPKASPDVSTEASPLAAITGYADVLEYFGQYDYSENGRYFAAGDLMSATGMAEAAVPVPSAAPTMDSGASPSSVAASDYSGTNVQVAGVDEADIVKTDGKSVFILRNGNELIVVSADGADTAELARLTVGSSDYSDKSETGDYSGREEYGASMYLAGDRLVILKNIYEWSNTANNYFNSERLVADIYDVSDPASPKLAYSVGQDGSLSDSRMFGGVLYLISNYYVYNWDMDEPDTFIPRLYCNGAQTLIAEGDICIPRGCTGTSWLVISSVDVASGEQLSSSTMLGGAGTIYMNSTSLYIANSSWSTEESEPYIVDQYSVVDYSESSSTKIMRFSIEDGSVAFAASGSVPGYLINQFAMDEFGGYLRAVTTSDGYSYRVYTDEKHGFSNYESTDNSVSTSGLYVLDGELNLVGSVDGLGEEERVYSVRFDGDIGYFVTFRQTDPLFAVDLSDPTAPAVLSALKIPGFSEYLHVYGDGLLFGLGMAADEETGRAECLKLSMFDTSDPADVSELATLEIKSVSYSPALYDHHACFIDPVKNIIGFATDSEFVFYAYADGAFTKLASSELVDYDYMARGLYIGEYLYICAANSVTVLNLADFTPAATVNLI